MKREDVLNEVGFVDSGGAEELTGQVMGSTSWPTRPPGGRAVANLVVEGGHRRVRRVDADLGLEVGDVALEAGGLERVAAVDREARRGDGRFQLAVQ